MCPAILPMTLLSLPAAVLPAPPKPPLLQAGPSQPSGLCPFASSSREPALVSPSPCVLHGTQNRCLGSVSRTSRGESLAVGAGGTGEGRGVPAWPISERLSPVTPGQHAHAVECRVACTRSGRPLCPGSFPPCSLMWLTENYSLSKDVSVFWNFLCVLGALMFLGNETHYMVFSGILRREMIGMSKKCNICTQTFL